METEILNGTAFQNKIFSEIRNEISRIDNRAHQTPGVAFIAFVGHTPLMKYTIALHDKAAKEIGFRSTIQTFPPAASEKEITAYIKKLNHDDSTHAIVLLQPVPEHINALNVIQNINREKEVEGFHPENILSTLTHGLFNTKYPMCLPAALLELFKYAGAEITKGQEFVFAADQDFITNPFRSLILKTASWQIIPPGCSYTIVNNDNAKIADFCKRADYLFVISENVEFLQPEWLKPGVCIIDIYSNLVKEIPSKKHPDTLIPLIKGGVNTEAVKNIAGKIAPCPGGLMPVLLAVMLRNAFKHALHVKGLQPAFE